MLTQISTQVQDGRQFNSPMSLIYSWPQSNLKHLFDMLATLAEHQGQPEKTSTFASVFSLGSVGSVASVGSVGSVGSSFVLSTKVTSDRKCSIKVIAAPN